MTTRTMPQAQRVVLRAGCAVALTGSLAYSPGAAAEDRLNAIVSEFNADAQARSSLFSSADAGHDGRFFISGDGFRLNIGGQVQMRYLLNVRDDDNAPADDVSNGFQIRRARFNFNGTLDKDWTYQVMADFGRTGEFTLFDAFFTRELADGLILQCGQFRIPVMREDIVLQNRQLAVERSLTADVLRPERAKGVGLIRTADELRASATLNSGVTTRNTDFDAPSNADLAFSGRLEWKPLGQWKHFDDFTSPRGGETGVLAGVAAQHQLPHNTGDPADTDRTLTIYTADLSFEGDGWNAFAAFTGRRTELRSLSGESAIDDFGFVAQAGFHVSQRVELFARWDALLLDDERSIDDEFFQFVTAGANWYIAGHALKVTGDVVYSVDRTDGLVGLRVLPSRGQGLLGSSEEGEVLARLQVQLLF